jgi:hypothetical protein
MQNPTISTVPSNLRREELFLTRGHDLCSVFFTLYWRRTQSEDRPFGGVLIASTVCSRSNELVIAIRGGGHSLCGDSFCDGSLLSTFQA